MTTPAKVADRLGALSRLLDGATIDLIEADEKAVRAKQAYVVAHAKATLQADGPADIRKATATVQTADLSLTAELAAHIVRAIKERIDTIHKQISVGQSIGAASRAELAALGSTGEI